MGAIHIPTYKEQQQQVKQQQTSNNQNNVDDQFANLPPQLMSTMNKDKKPFTYTPNSLIGYLYILSLFSTNAFIFSEKGLLDLSQIKSPRMKKRLAENQKDPEEQPQYFPVSPPRKLNILQEVKEQQQYQPEQQKQHYLPSQQQQQATYSPPAMQQKALQAAYSPPPLQQQAAYSPPPMQQQQQQLYSPPVSQQYTSYLPQSPIKQVDSPGICSTGYSNLNQQPKPFQRQTDEWFPQYEKQQQYFNIEPPKKIDIYKEIHEQPHLPETKIYAPTLQEQWQQRKQHSPVKNFSQQPSFYEQQQQQQPIQSKSFNVLQQMVKNSDEQQQQHQQQQYRPLYEEEVFIRPTIPSNAFRNLQTMVGISNEEASRQRIIPIQIERQNSQQQQLYVAPSQQERIKTPPTYQGASIPSRSFRLLQIMTDEDQQQLMRQRITTSGFEGTDF